MAIELPWQLIVTRELQKRNVPVGTYEKNCLPERQCHTCKRSVCIFDKGQVESEMEPENITDMRNSVREKTGSPAGGINTKNWITEISMTDF